MDPVDRPAPVVALLRPMLPVKAIRLCLRPTAPTRRLQARLHGHEHVEPLEMSSYGAKTSFGVGVIHGIGAETGTQVLLIAAVGGVILGSHSRDTPMKGVQQ